MDNKLIVELTGFTTPHLADACMRAKVPVRCAPPEIGPIETTWRSAGHARPVQHLGSIDVFLEGLEQAAPGDVLVIDNGGRRDEACIGDLVVLEAKKADLAGIVIWGFHRDSAELQEIGFPVFSLGALPIGPQRLDARPADAFTLARIGPHTITVKDVVVADANGILFLPEHQLGVVVEAAAIIRETEHRQIEALKGGRGLRDQLRFAEYLARRREDATYSLRNHLRNIDAAGEV